MTTWHIRLDMPTPRPRGLGGALFGDMFTSYYWSPAGWCTDRSDGTIFVHRVEAIAIFRALRRVHVLTLGKTGDLVLVRRGPKP